MVDYHAALRSLKDWEPYLLEHSNLPGPRANLDLAQAAADLATPSQIESLLAYDVIRAPTNTPGEFLALCGTIALGRLLVEGHHEVVDQLKLLANDPRWRVREGVAMALQRLGDKDMPALLRIIQPWAAGAPYEQRAAVAALCEPRLLVKPEYARAAFDLLDEITRTIPHSKMEKTEPFRALRNGLGYCWSVAVAALPDEGKARFEKWAGHPNKNIRWIARENLKKSRLTKLDKDWVERLKAISA